MLTSSFECLATLRSAMPASLIGPTTASCARAVTRTTTTPKRQVGRCRCKRHRQGNLTVLLVVNGGARSGIKDFQPRRRVPQFGRTSKALLDLTVRPCPDPRLPPTQAFLDLAIGLRPGRNQRIVREEQDHQTRRRRVRRFLAGKLRT